LPHPEEHVWRAPASCSARDVHELAREIFMMKLHVHQYSVIGDKLSRHDEGARAGRMASAFTFN
jgi:hypothetical protein